ncbi:hypothetical protein BJ085DRAFT_32036 [Dimargaris cristalligena]|uniref:Uncharacterized protein n=1 Tax=Dimargaris cristalligena TaxID=215637 RepID=A0A4P9ZLG4_9FUNG|nr:hypothetical protein BJ085DRAFT_32036 [Dimargaris cristalligena]|eukprot:RKP34134.1 hypothetical protein BJ085DRAFT_32036 [Dimargaris cristalligena]
MVRFHSVFGMALCAVALLALSAAGTSAAAYKQEYNTEVGYDNSNSNSKEGTASTPAANAYPKEHDYEKPKKSKNEYKDEYKQPKKSKNEYGDEYKPKKPKKPKKESYKPKNEYDDNQY